MEKDLTKLFELSDLESFDPKAFEGDSVVPQDVCNFVLTLALVFNLQFPVVSATGTPIRKGKV
jgi:hypothetical protein